MAAASLVERDLTFAYQPGRAVFSHVDADFPAGSVTAVTGPSGAGKSTLLYVLALMMRPTGGTVLLDGTRVDDRSDAARADLRAQHFGFVFQDGLLDPARTILDNTLETSLYRGADRRAEAGRALELLEQFGVAESPHRRPGQISGGQAQRVALCRALLGRPTVLVADEPTGNLDAASGRVVMDALRTHAEHSAVIVATHDAGVIERCDAVVRVA